MSLLRCLSKQLKEMENDPPAMCSAMPVDPSVDMFNWTGFIRGPDGTPFEGGIFHLSIHFPTDFPFKPPRIRFTTRVYHPNVSPQGDICLDILHDKWSPALSLRSVLMSICSLLTDPNPEHGLDNDILNVYRTNKAKYETNAREWTRKYAMENQDKLMSLARRLTHHYHDMEKNPPPLCHARPEDPGKDMTHWIGYIDGPQNTPYDGGRFHLTIDFPLDYPFKPPQMRFITPIYHPNIGTNGEICLDILHSQWSPVLTTRTLLISLCSLLTDPNPEHGLNKEALDIYRIDQQKYQQIARQWTQNYAVEHKPIEMRF